MKKIITSMLLCLFTFACAPIPTPQVIVVTVVVQPTTQLSINTPAATPTIAPTFTPTVTPNPCLLWSQVTSGMAGQTICVRGIIRRIDNTFTIKSQIGSHWDFADNRTGFFAISAYLGWHPTTGKDMSVGDCVAITGKIQVLSNGRPYIYWGENSIYHSTVPGASAYYEHPDLQVIENNPSFCQ